MHSRASVEGKGRMLWGQGLKYAGEFNLERTIERNGYAFGIESLDTKDLQIV
jgi:hypothetical protein